MNTKQILNIHQLIDNPAVRNQLSFFVPKTTLDTMKTRRRKPSYKTIIGVTQGIKEIYKDERTDEDIARWLGEPPENK